jgi:signal transduction histidine kinase
VGGRLPLPRMSRWRPLFLATSAALAGAVGTLAVGAATGMPGDELGHLTLLLLPALGVTMAVAFAFAPLLSRASFAQRLVAVTLIAVLMAVGNLAVLAQLMFVSDHDATQVAILLAYSLGAALGVAIVLSRASSRAIDRLAGTARRLGQGDLDARPGRVDAGPELDALAATLDEMARRLQESLENARAADKQRRDLITAVSHDLRTPLSSLRAMVEAVDDGVVDDPVTLRRYTTEMRGAVESLVALVDDLFELVQLDAAAIRSEAHSIRLAEAVSAAIGACSAQAAAKGLLLETRLNGAGAEPCSPRLGRVLQNLLQNAIRHTPGDGSVRVEATRGPQGLTVVVADSGEGIPSEALERVFDPFWRGDAARATEGSGLGLTLAKRIVESLGGQIGVESEPHRGSRFAVALPAGR